MNAAAKPAKQFHPSSFWGLQLIGWGIFAMVDLVNRQLAYFDLPIALALTGIVFPTMIILSTGLRRIYDRSFGAAALSSPMLLVMALLSCAGAAVVVAVLAMVRAVAGWNVPNWPLAQEVALPFFHYVLSLFGWSLLYFWIRADQLRHMAHAAAAAAQADALRAEIQQLRLQINPHFLFNALNGIGEEIPEQPATALAMMRDLTAYLRHVLAGIRTPVVSVAAEVEALSAYLRIQEARFGPALRTTVSVESGASSCAIPSGLLQPLVENAVEHGDRSSVLDVSLQITHVGNGLRIEVANVGALDPARRRPTSHGLGIENLRRRLAVHYPRRHAFSLEQVGVPPRVVAVLQLDGAPCSAS